MAGLTTTFPPNISEKFQGDGFYPPPITKMEDTGLSPLWLQDLALKILYFQIRHTRRLIRREHHTAVTRPANRAGRRSAGHGAGG